MKRPDWMPDWLPGELVVPQWALDAWAYTVKLWSTGVLGLTYGQIFSAVGVLLLALIIRGVFARTVVRAISRAASGTATHLDDALVESISEPLKLAPMIAGVYVALIVMHLNPSEQVYGDKVLQSMVALTVFWTFSRAAGAFSYVLGELENTLGWLVRTFQMVFLAMGIAAILQIWGVQVLPIIAGLGVFGVAIAFGAQDLVKNLISGIFLLVEKRFVPGDWVLVEGVAEGTVETIGFRSTTIRQFDRAPRYVPNAIFSDRPVINFSRMTHRRIKWALGVEYRTSVDQLKFIRDEIEAYLWTSGDFALPPAATLLVHVDSFGPSSIDFLVYCFTVTTKWDEHLRAKERLAYKIMEIIKAAGTDFAFPSQTLYMQKQDPPEPFTPPGPSPAVAQMQEKRRVGADAGARSDDEGDGRD